jgi:uncharacterized protein YtpQ (UPF0354 family)
MECGSILDRVLPQFFPRHWLDAPGLMYRDFPSRIQIGYVLRGMGEYSYLLEDDFSTLGRSADDLHSAALMNLARLPGGSVSIAKMPDGGEGWISATEDNFAAVRILLSGFQQELSSALGDGFLFTIPHRDDCFCWSEDQLPEHQERHARDAMDAFLREDYNLSPDIFRCSAGRIELFQLQIVS